jgi:CRISPR-associated protein (TIGR03985 family)
MIWHDPPSVPLLQWLARGSLKQNLLQAIRLWVWLHLLYGKPGIQVQLPDPFSYADWRDAFFSPSHPKRDEKPDTHDPHCPCAGVTAEWLFGDRLHPTGYPAAPGGDWDQRSQDFIQALHDHDALPQNIEHLLFETRLFAVTGRTLRHDLQVLADINWLQPTGQAYQRVSEFPARPALSPEHTAALSRLAASDLEFFTQPDLAAIADSLAQDLNGQRRFFVHVEYVVPPQFIDLVDEWQSQLREIWLQAPVPPVQLQYHDVKLQQVWSGSVYPVCLYYYRRGPYLCGFGQVPDRETLNWRNYRLDRIQDITALSWDVPQLPKSLVQCYHQHRLPTPDDIHQWMMEAWGFDYYQPAQMLLLRFDQEWNERYIHNSFRHPTFQPVSYERAGELLATNLHGKEKTELLKVWRSRSPTDAYYQAQIRQGDPNVWQRIRAWRPNVEVLLPAVLRRQFAQEALQEARLYEF